MSPPFDLLPLLSKGLFVTVKIFFGSTVIAFIAAFSAGLAKISTNRMLRYSACIYVEIFRGTSALIQLFWLYYALPLFGVRLDAFAAGCIGLGLNIGAYGAEVVRGAVESIPKSQREAAVALNLNRFETMARIILPQACVQMLPPFGNLAIELLKSTSLVSLITLGDLTFQAQSIRSATFRTPEIFAIVLIIYFFLAATITFTFRIIEHKVGHNKGLHG